MFSLMKFLEDDYFLSVDVGSWLGLVGHRFETGFLVADVRLIFK
jgi:hypothetical protein